MVGEPPYGSSQQIIIDALGSTTYKGLNVKGSFGMGRATAVPWLGFFGYGQKTEKGSYPVFLYFKEQKKLVLAFGVSETNPPERQWVNLETKSTIRAYFAEKELGSPARYGSSYVCNVYNAFELNDVEIERDLDAVISEFHQLFANDNKDADLVSSSVAAALASPEIKFLLDDPDFHFAKGQRALIDFESFPTTPEFLGKLWLDYDSALGDFNAKLSSFKGQADAYDFVVLMSKVISYCDANAANKKTLNEYEDSRTLARAGIRQGNWIRNLITYKTNGNRNVNIPDSIGNALTYLKNPTSELTMLSEKHRQMVSKNLLEQETYNKELFVEQVLDYFSQFSIVPKNADNLTRIVSKILYLVPEVKTRWYEESQDDLLEPVDDGEEVEIDFSAMAFESIGFEDDMRTVITAIKTKPFVLLAGLSGTGKSRLVRSLAFLTCFDSRLQKDSGKPGNFELITVKPNWHDSTELIGYISRINGEKYLTTTFLQFVAKAWRFQHVPFFLCLDEMNLAPVEQYFAEYLSISETRIRKGEHIRSDNLISRSQFEDSALYDDLINNLGLADRPGFSEGLSIPNNFIVIGTVNMDETTHSFSRKVLDRAMTFEMNEVDLSAGLSREQTDWSYPETFLDPQSVIGMFNAGFEVADLYPESRKVVEYLERLNKILEETPFKIAYRVRDEFLIYCYYSSQYKTTSTNWLDVALDEMTAMKVLSRIEGDEAKTARVLRDLDSVLNDNYTRTTSKLTEMRRRLENNGYTSFWS